MKVSVELLGNTDDTAPGFHERVERIRSVAAALRDTLSPDDVGEGFVVEFLPGDGDDGK